MERRILIDLAGLRLALIADPGMKIPEGFLPVSGKSEGMKTIRELAVFRFTCRKCEDAPCISVCPADALEKDGEGIIDRHLNLCISCKSCVTICPFGTMMTDFFRHHRNRDLFFDLDDPRELELFVEACPPGTVTFTNSGEAPEKNIFSLNDRVLVRDYLYTPANK
jgi:Fe-S-cluster-containing hydrogenase component 2